VLRLDSQFCAAQKGKRIDFVRPGHGIHATLAQSLSPVCPPPVSSLLATQNNIECLKHSTFDRRG